MSKKYIECEAAKEQIRAHIIIGEPKTNVGLNLAVEAIDEVPAADVVEVVRCRECRFAHLTWTGDCKYCDKLIEYGVDDAVYLPGDFYCADGERKDGGQEPPKEEEANV